MVEKKRKKRIELDDTNYGGAVTERSHAVETNINSLPSLKQIGKAERRRGDNTGVARTTLDSLAIET